MLKIPVLEGRPLHSGARMIAGVVSARDILPLINVPTYNPITGDGYQRAPHMKRIKKLAQHLQTVPVDLPTAVMFSLRGKEAKNFVKNGILTLPSKSDVYTVDGQHRLAALKMGISSLRSKGKEDEARDLENFKIFFVMMIGGTEQEEMKQFYTINNEARPVKTDLALELIQKMSSDKYFIQKLVEEKTDWKVQAHSLAKRLNAESNVWKWKIRFASQTKSDTSLPVTSMVTSLQPIYQASYFRNQSQDTQYKIIDTYWSALHRIFPKAIADYTNYALQKGVGALVMHALLPSVCEVIRSEKGSLLKENDYYSVLLDPLNELSGVNQEGDTVKGLDFWLSGRKGAAGSFSSGAGKQVLVATLTNALPKTDEI